MHLGIAGEVRAVVSRADGSVKTDTGFQKNLILDQGLNFFGGGKGNFINDRCAIGGGNSTPAITQTGLDAFAAITTGTDITDSYAYSDDGSNLYKMWEQKKYRFENLDNVNVAEVGLVSNGTSGSNYYLTTRALIKDSGGSPTTITVKLGETLDIYYKIHKVIDLTDKEYVVNIFDGSGGTVPYNVVVRPAYVGDKIYNEISKLFDVYTRSSNQPNIVFSSSELAAVTAAPVGGEQVGTEGVLVQSPYVLGSFKRVLEVRAGLNNANSEAIRTIFQLKNPSFSFVSVKFLPFQIRFGSVADDSPIIKTNKDTLTIPLEFSWGRYEGEL